MPKKLTYDEVKHYIEVESESKYTLLSTTYKSGKSKITIECKDGHIYETSFSMFKGSKKRKGTRCSKCFGIEKQTIEEVKEIFNMRGLVLEDSQIYKNCKQSLVASTSEKYRVFVSLDNIKNKKNYSPSPFHTKNPYTIWNIRNIWLPKNAPDYELLEDKWNGNAYLMKWRLKNSNLPIFEMSWNKFYQKKMHPIILKSTNDQKTKEVSYGVAVKEINEILNDSNSSWKIAKNNEKIFIDNKTHLYFIDNDGYITLSSTRSLKAGKGIKKFHISYPETSLYNFRRWLGLNSIYKLKDDSAYNGYNKKTTLVCKKHGDFESSPSLIMDMKSGCPKCGGTLKVTHSEFLKEIEFRVGEEYSVMGEYQDRHSKIRLMHNTCNKSYKVTPSGFLRGNRCPYCVSSRGESDVTAYLKLLNIATNVQKRFDYCINVRPLPFDFYVQNKILIEYDGQDHFYSIDRSGRGVEWADSQYLVRTQNDKIKNQYCIDNNIPLIRIPYWEFNNIELILSSVLMHFNLIEKDDSYREQLVTEWLVDSNWDHAAYLAKCPKNKKDIEVEDKILQTV